MKVIAKTFRILVVLVISAGLILFAMFLIKRKKSELSQAPTYGLRPVPVRVTTAKLGNLSTKIDYLAVVEPVQVANVSARLTAAVDKLLCDEGDTVKAGDVLIILDGREIRDDIASVQADIAQIQAELAANEATVTSLESSVAYWNREANRDKTLADKGDIPGAQAEATADKANEFKGRLDAAKNKSTAFKHLTISLENKRAQLETRLSYCTIKSPYDGLITQRLVDPGDMASPGKKLFVVEDRSQLRLAFDIPQQDLPKVREGLNVIYDVNGRQLRSELSHLFPSLDMARMVRAEVLLSEEKADGLSSGQYVSVAAVLDELQNVVLLPTSCLVESPEHFPHVFVLNGDKLAHRKVTVLASSGERVAIEGIKPGTQVITNTFLGWTRLSGDMKVEVLK